MKFTGHVIKGIQVGAKFGIATANLEINAPLDLVEGVHLVTAEVREKTYHGLLHYGHRQTFGGEFSVEVHLLDFSAEIYGKDMTVTTHKFLRPTKKFQNGDELFTQIERDITQARKYFLRELTIQKWNNYSPNDIAERTDIIVQKLTLNDNFQRHKNILIYAPTQYEFPFAEKLCAEFPRKNWYFPRIENNTMTFHNSDFSSLVSEKFGIKSPPKSAEKFSFDQPAFCLVPGLAADTKGNRLGRGGGFYDRFLEQIREQSSDFYTSIVIPKFAYSDYIPHESHDQPVDEVILV